MQNLRKDRLTFLDPTLVQSIDLEALVPLDLDDEVVTSDDPSIVNDAISKLDADGWATDNQIRPASWIRLRLKLGYVKERFLEASLAGKKQDFIIEEIE